MCPSVLLTPPPCVPRDSSRPPGYAHLPLCPHTFPPARLTESRLRRRGSIKGAIALLKVASEADKAAKGGDAAAALAALTNYREAVDALDPAGEAVAALPAQNREKVMEKRAQAMKRIAKLEALAEPAPEMVRDYTVDYTPSQREPAPVEEAPTPAEEAPAPPEEAPAPSGGDLKAGLAKIKAASEADNGRKRSYTQIAGQLQC